MNRKNGNPPENVVTEEVSALPGVNPPPGEPPEQLTHALAFTVVGIGASAGGLEACSHLLRALPLDTDMAFVIVQHLDPHHESMLSEILARTTAMPVLEAQHDRPIEPNHVYVIPPGKNMFIGDGRLKLSPRTEQRGQHRPIDLFFRSLAEHQGHLSIGVILSGSSSDGTLGLQEIKAAGGVTFAQDDTAEHTTMPRSAVAEGCIDFVLTPDDIAREIARGARHPHLSGQAAALARSEGKIGRVLDILRQNTGVDFTNYKRNTLHRRITRRMLLHKLDGVPEYVRFLQSTPAEVQALYQDVLISVTSFFRDPEAYETIKKRVFPRLVEGKSRADQVRVWALGCSTGEEAYSLAMAYSEFAETVPRCPTLQIFATDLNGNGIEKARSGMYAKGITQDVSAERLRRFFVDAEGGYRVSKPIRDMCIFARQNVLADPPFSRMNLIACRNMLIYLDPVLQQQLMPVLHYALQPVGFLWLGSSETIGNFRDLFEIEDSKNKIYLKKSVPSHLPPRIPHQVAMAAPRTQRGAPAEVSTSISDQQSEADRILLQRYAPAGVVVNFELEIQQFRGDTSAFLTPAPGRATLNLLKMLREGLLVAVRDGINRARRENTVVRLQNLHTKTDSGFRDVQVTVTPMNSGSQGNYLLVTFETQDAAKKRQTKTAAEAEARAAQDDGDSNELARVRQELDSTRDYMQSLIEQQEAANEELQSANEEVQSANEELQSINEELETSKEEIQSSNEELATVNDELQNRNLELTQSNNDLLNLFSSVQIAIVMLGRDLRIRRFTPPAEKMLNLIPADIGRPIADIKLGLSIANVEQLLATTIESVTVNERVVKNKDGHWCSLRLHPYKTQENQIDGVVLVLLDIDRLTRAEFAATESEHRFSQLADSAPALIWVSGPEGHQYVNKTFLEFLGVTETEIQNFGWARYVHPEDRDAYVAMHRDRVARMEPFENQFRFRRADGAYRWMKSIGVPRMIEGQFLGYIGLKFDITDMKEAEATLREADASKNNFLATLAHELRTPLAAMRNAVQVIGHPGGAQMTERAKSVIERQTVQMVRMVDDLLDLSRLTRGTFRLRTHSTDLLEALRQAIEATAHERDAKAQELILDMPDQPIMLDADAARLQQVFANLLGNAARYTPMQGKVWITVERLRAAPPGSAGADQWHRPRAQVRIRDNGIGIDGGMLPRIFDLFSQADQAPGQTAGLGIGLNLAKRLIDLHGGSIVASSAGKDQGSQFVITLPVDESTDLRERARTDRDAAAKIAQSAPVRVLVVDDNVDAAEMLVNLLQLARQDVRSANDGAAALRVAHEFRPQLALLDISMPKMNGIELAQRLREVPGLGSIVIVAVTGYGPGDTAVDLSGGGFNERVTKPLEQDVLLSLIARVQKENAS